MIRSRAVLPCRLVDAADGEMHSKFIINPEATKMFYRRDDPAAVRLQRNQTDLPTSSCRPLKGRTVAEPEPVLAPADPRASSALALASRKQVPPAISEATLTTPSTSGEENCTDQPRRVWLVDILILTREW
jgi:hypothetical protein